MGSFDTTNQILALVNNDRLVFFSLSGEGVPCVVASLPFASILDDGIDLREQLPAGKWSIPLLVVPDFWLGVNSYLIASPKKSLVDLFVQKKLGSEYPDIPRCQDFYDYAPVQMEQGKAGVQVYAFQEAQFADLYQHLERQGLCPEQITTPGLLWEARLRESVPEFAGRAVCLIDLVGAECFFYFFHQGRYLFSRDLSISNRLEAETRLNALSYEIDQSRFLFSQKSKSQVDTVYFIPSKGESLTAQDLSRRLRSEVHEFNGGAAVAGADLPEELNPVAHFLSPALLRGDQAINLAHRQIKKEREWLPVQKAGLFLGAFLLLAFALQAAFLHWWVPAEWMAVDPRADREHRRTVREYNLNLDAALKELRRTLPTEVIAKVAEILPDNVWIEQMSIALAPKKTLSLVTVVKADEPEEFDRIFTALIRNARTAFGKRVSPQQREVSFTRLEERDEASALGDFRLEMEVDLP